MLKSIWPWSKKQQAIERAVDPFSLDTPLWNWSKYDPHMIRDSVSNWSVFGATGQGKTSGPAAFFATQHLAAGFGGMFTCVKPNDLEEQLGWCRDNGRQSDVIIFGPLELPWRFNFLQYVLDSGGGTEEIVQVLLNVLELREIRSGGGGGENAEFFNNQKKKCLRSIVDVLVMAKGSVTVSDIHKMIITSPASMEQMRSEDFRKGSFCMRSLDEADNREKNPSRREDLSLAADYFCMELPSQSDRTRTSITSTVTGLIDLLLRSPLRELLCSTTNFTPMDLACGKVLLNGLNLKQHGEIAATVQVILKYSFQRAIEQRDIRQNPRPVFLQVDEFQHLTTSYDAVFATTCRSSRVSFGLLSQSLPVLYAALGGGDKAKVEIDALLSNTNLRIFCANGCSTTNTAASEMIGKNRQYHHNISNGGGDDDVLSVLSGRGSNRTSTSMSETVDYEVPSQVFTQLRPGGPPDFEVDTIIFRPGRPFKATGRNWMRMAFRQK
jgi:type IV secretory pathway TraG/TraD family ATPase VirD4